MIKGQPKQHPGIPPMTDKMLAVRESEFQATVIEMAQAFGWEPFYIPDSRRSAQVWRPNGWPDLTLCHPIMAILLFVECKTDSKASKLSPDQQKWLVHLENCGATVQVWRPSMWSHIEAVLQGPETKSWNALENTDRVGMLSHDDYDAVALMG